MCSTAINQNSNWVSKYGNCTFHHVVGCLCLVVCKGEHTTLLLVLVLTLVALLTWSVTLLVSWPLLALLRVPLLSGVLLTLLTLLAWLVLLVLVRWLLLLLLLWLLVLWSGWSVTVVRYLWTIPNMVIGTATKETPVAGLPIILYTVSQPTTCCTPN